MSITLKKQQQLKERMKFLGIKEEDLVEKFILPSKKGGQKMQKTHSCVYIKHLPTQIEIKCQKDRQRVVNRYLARAQLCGQIEELVLGTNKKIEKAKKIQKQKQRKVRKQKAKLKLS